MPGRIIRNMLENLQKKMMNGYLLANLGKMSLEVPKNFSKVMEVQNRRVQKLAQRAYRIPFYRERFDRAGVKPGEIRTGDDLTRLPVLTKDELREWMGSLKDQPQYKDWICDTTSGSTGKPVSVLFSPREKAYMKANWYRVMLCCGYNPLTGKTMSRINMHDVNPGGRDTALQNLGVFRHAFVDQYAPEPEVIDRINEYRPDWLYMNKTELMRLVLYAKRTGKQIFHPKFYDPISEKVTENDRALFIEQLGPGIIDSYGSAETGACMLRLPDKDYYVVHNDSFVVNVVDDEGQLTRQGRVIITPLYKTDLPLINYEVGDRAVMRTSQGVHFITNMEGRLNDYFRYEDGRVTSFFEVTPVIAHCPDILQIRFIQKTWDLIHVQIVRDEKAGMSREQLEEYLVKSLNGIFKRPFSFEFEWMQVIPPDKNGKLRMIICEAG